MPVLTIKNSTGKIYSINQLVPYFAYYIQDNTTGEPIMTVITKDVSLIEITAYMAINRTWSGI